MAIEEELRELLRRVRAGDHKAAAQIISHYQPEIRRFIRARLTDARLHRILDSMDIFQSVFANFYVRLIAGLYDLNEPTELFRLLRVMVRNKVIDAARKLENRRTEDADTGFWEEVADTSCQPSRLLANADLLAAAQRLLTEEEKLLVELRAEGRSWPEIGEQQGVPPEALRKRLARALDRVCRELGMNEASHEE